MSADAAMVDDLVADAGDLPALPRPTAEDINKSGFTKEMTKKWLVELAGSLKNAGCKAADRVGVLKAKLKELLDVDDAEEEDAGDVEGAAAKRVQERFAAAKDPAAVAFCVRQQLDASAKQLSKGKETVQKVRRSLDQLRVALMIGDPVFWVDGQGVVQPASWVSVQHHAVRACLVVGDEEKTAARMNALDAEIDARLRPQAGGGRRGAAKQVNQGFDAPDPILAAIGVAGQQRLMFEYWCVWGDKPLAPVEQPINVPYDKGSYMAQLYGAVQDHLHQAGQRKVPNMESIKAFRDFLCKWCHVWASWSPPFAADFSVRDDWSDDQWRTLPMLDPESYEGLDDAVLAMHAMDIDDVGDELMSALEDGDAGHVDDQQCQKRQRVVLAVSEPGELEEE